MLLHNLLEYSWSYSDMTNIDAFKSFNYEVRLLGDTEADLANRILRNTTITVPLKT